MLMSEAGMGRGWLVVAVLGEEKGVSVRVCRSWVAREEEMKRAEEGDEKSEWMRLERGIKKSPAVRLPLIRQITEGDSRPSPAHSHP